jgi:hypothetical protein
MTREYAIAAIVGLILVTSLRLGGFPPAIAVALRSPARRDPHDRVGGLALIRGTVPNTPAAYRNDVCRVRNAGCSSRRAGISLRGL